jgi:hypothetical protein
MSDDRWADARRLEAWAGEVRVNLIRTLALIVFYANHLFNAYVLDDVTARGKFHTRVSVVVVAWGMAAFTLFVCLSRRWVPPALKYVAVVWDLLYFLVVASAPLRLSLELVYCATFGSMVCAAAVLWHFVYVTVTPAAYYSADSAVRIPKVNQILFLLAVGAAGLLAGQMVRQARRLVQGYPVTVGEPREAA